MIRLKITNPTFSTLMFRSSAIFNAKQSALRTVEAKAEKAGSDASDQEEDAAE